MIDKIKEILQNLKHKVLGHGWKQLDYTMGTSEQNPFTREFREVTSDERILQCSHCDIKKKQFFSDIFGVWCDYGSQQ